MNEPLDSRAQQTVNRLRLLVGIPVLVAAIGVFFLAKELARQFRERRESFGQAPAAVRPGKRLVVNVTLDLTDAPKSEAAVTEE
ncbi:MAG: hypothetical protein RL514_1905 [Verrucomicrobiota bacterium]|jgi:hypothetical protein